MTGIPFTANDLALMGRALALAPRGQGRVEPNPMVGCVLARGSHIVSEGFHKRFGGPHAEVETLRAAGGSARRTTAYVTLEPCAHHGKTPPCTEALIAAGVERVIAAVRDPAPEVAGRGVRRLRAAGIEVHVGCLEAEAREINAPYWTLVTKGRPYVILKWAQGLDGRLAVPTGQPRTISGPSARHRVHRLRARVDGILVGVGTVLADDPLLTARDTPLRRLAARIVLDTRLRIPVSCNLVRTAEAVPTLVLTSRAALADRASKPRQLRQAGVELMSCRLHKGRIDLSNALLRLGRRRMTNLLVEGGPTVIDGFLRRGLADEALIFVAPRIIGGRGAQVSLAGPKCLTGAITSRPVPPDTLFHIRF